jgi:hypothetical protein
MKAFRNAPDWYLEKMCFEDTFKETKVIINIVISYYRFEVEKAVMDVN